MGLGVEREVDAHAHLVAYGVILRPLALADVEIRTHYDGLALQLRHVVVLLPCERECDVFADALDRERAGRLIVSVVDGFERRRDEGGLRMLLVVEPLRIGERLVAIAALRVGAGDVDLDVEAAAREIGGIERDRGVEMMEYAVELDAFPGSGETELAAVVYGPFVC